MKRAVLYRRVSREEQAEDDRLSLESQEYAGNQLAQQRNAEIVRVYTEPGKSAYYDNIANRPAMRALMADAENLGDFDEVYVYDLSRWARNTEIGETLCKRLSTLGIQLYSHSEPIDNSTPAGQFTRTMFFATAQLQSALSGQKISDAMKARARKGLFNGPRPFGYCSGQCPPCKEEKCPNHGSTPQVEKGNLFPHPLEAQGVTLAFATFANEAQCYRDVADTLNRGGYQTVGKHRKGGQPWHPRAVSHLLQNPLYVGMVRNEGKAAKGVHPALITDTLWKRVQEKIRRFKERPPRAPFQKRPHPLTPVAFCNRCKGPLAGATSGEKNWVRRIYKCYNRHRFRDDPAHGCDLPNLNADACEQLVSTLLAKISLPADWREQVLARRGKPAPKGPTREFLLQRLDRLSKQHEWGHLSDDEYLEKYAAIQGEMGALQQPVQGDLLEVGQLLEDLPRLWKEAGKDGGDKAQRLLLLELFEALYFDLSPDGPVLASYRFRASVAPLFEIFTAGQEQ